MRSSAWLLLVGLLATNSVAKNDVYGELDVASMFYRPYFKQIDSKRDTVNRVSITIRDEWIEDDTKTVIDLGYVGSDNEMYNNMFKDTMRAISIFYVNELYVSKGIGDYTINVGQFMFRKGTFHEYSFNGNRVGNGIYGTIEDNMQGLIVTKRIDSTSAMAIGKVWTNKWFDTIVNDYKQKDFYTDSNAWLLIYKKQIQDVYAEANAYRVNTYMNGNDIGNTNLLNVGADYNKEDTTGVILYGFMSYSESELDTTKLSPIGRGFETKSIFFGEHKSSGLMTLLGFKKLYDIGTKEYFAGAEVEHITEGYHNHAIGKPFELYEYSNIGITKNIYAGIKLNRNATLRLRYCVFDSSGKAYKNGLNTKSADVEDIPNAPYKTDSWTIQFYADW